MLFSIFMCTYNSSETLVNAIESLLKQSYKDWELIVIDNGSKDTSVDILRDYEKKDKRILCRYNVKNIGWCKGIRECLKIASGEYMMFLGADDMVVNIDTLYNIANEIYLHNKPDIVWTGNYFADYIDGKYNLISQCIPEYKYYQSSTMEEKLKHIIYLMKHVYYNSVMHYINIDFLKKYNIDFYEPYYSDCQGMTLAMCKAENMIALDSAEYLLVRNTSQTSQSSTFDYNIAMQWKLIHDEFSQMLYDVKYKNDFHYIAMRIANNMVGILNSIISGSKLRDLDMNPIEVDYVERFLKAEKWLSDRMFIEMLEYAGRENYINSILCQLATTLYKDIIIDKMLIEKLCRESKWLVSLVTILFEFDGDVVKLREYIGEKEYMMLKEVINCEYNFNKVGIEYVGNSKK